MTPYPPLNEEDATYYAETMTDVERKVIALCSKRESWGYLKLAEKIDVTYDEISDVGHRLQAMNLASVRPIRRGSEFAGSAIFLNHRGEQVRLAIEAQRQSKD